MKMAIAGKKGRNSTTFFCGNMVYRRLIRGLFCGIEHFYWFVEKMDSCKDRTHGTPQKFVNNLIKLLTKKLSLQFVWTFFAKGDTPTSNHDLTSPNFPYLPSQSRVMFSKPLTPVEGFKDNFRSKTWPWGRKNRLREVRFARLTQANLSSLNLLASSWPRGYEMFSINHFPKILLLYSRSIPTQLESF